MSDKKAIEENIFYYNYKVMKEDMKRYTKLEDIQHEDFRDIQNYMKFKSVAKARLAFRIRSKMVKSIKLNFKNMYSDLNCGHCDMGEQESQAHTMMCQGWEEERRGLDLTQIEDTVQFFTRILQEKGRKEQ